MCKKNLMNVVVRRTGALCYKRETWLKLRSNFLSLKTSHSFRGSKCENSGVNFKWNLWKTWSTSHREPNHSLTNKSHLLLFMICHYKKQTKHNNYPKNSHKEGAREMSVLFLNISIVFRYILCILIPFFI